MFFAVRICAGAEPADDQTEHRLCEFYRLHGQGAQQCYAHQASKKVQSRISLSADRDERRRGHHARCRRDISALSASIRAFETAIRETVQGVFQQAWTDHARQSSLLHLATERENCRLYLMHARRRRNLCRIYWARLFGSAGPPPLSLPRSRHDQLVHW